MASAPPSSFKLRGHQGSVSCLDHNQKQPCNGGPSSSLLVLSGSEDKTARLWDLRDNDHRRRACLCLSVHNEVTAVAFAPPPFDSSGSAASRSQNGDGGGDDDAHTKEKTAPPPRLASPFAQDCTVFVATASGEDDNQNNYPVLGFDLRQASSPIVQWSVVSEEPDNNQNNNNNNCCWNLSAALQNQDEINQLAFSPCFPVQPQQQQQQQQQRNKRRGGGKHHNHKRHHHQQQQSPSAPPSPCLAVADDAGHIRITSQWQDPAAARIRQQGKEEEGETNVLVLEHEAVPSAASMITSAVFRPSPLVGTKSHSNPCFWLATGGTDCAVCLWDVLPRRPKCLSRQVMPLTTSGTNQVCNPPMVHALAWSLGSSSSPLLAAGLGDGSFSVLAVAPQQRRLVPQFRVEDAHSGPVASVVFPDWTRSRDDSSNERLLLTAGNDGRIVAWDLGRDIAGAASSSHFSGDGDDDDEDTDAPARWFPSSLLADSSLKDVDGSTNNPQSLFAIAHSDAATALPLKPNWMVATPASAPDSPHTILLADTSHDITGYVVPLITTTTTT